MISSHFISMRHTEAVAVGRHVSEFRGWFGVWFVYDISDGSYSKKSCALTAYSLFSFLCLLLAHYHFASKWPSWKALVGKKWFVYVPKQEFVVLPVYWSMLYLACSFQKWVTVVLCGEMFACIQKADFIRKAPRGVWHSDCKWNNTAACFTVRSCSNERSGCVFICLHRWQ